MPGMDSSGLKTPGCTAEEGGWGMQVREAFVKSIGLKACLLPPSETLGPNSFCHLHLRLVWQGMIAARCFQWDHWAVQMPCDEGAPF